MSEVQGNNLRCMGGRIPALSFEGGVFVKASELLDNIEPGVIGDFGINAEKTVVGIEYEKLIEHITDMNAHVSRVDRLRTEIGEENIGTIRVTPPTSGMAQSRIAQAIADAANLGKDVCEIVLGAGIYTVDTSMFGKNIVRVTAGRKVILRGENAVLRLVGSAEAVVVYNLLDYSIISNLIIEGNAAAIGIHIRGDNVTVEGVKVYNCGTGVLVDGEHCTIENSLLRGCETAVDTVDGYSDYLTTHNVEVMS